MNMDHRDAAAATVAVVGAGSWGTALANLLADKGYEVDLWAYEKEVCEQINQAHENQIFLPGQTLSENLRAHNDPESVIRGKSMVLLVVPSHLMRATIGRFAPFFETGQVVVSASKGIENESSLTMSQVLKEVLAGKIDDQHLAVLSGPSFAKEVAAKVPTAVSVAAPSRDVAGYVQQIFSTPYFRVYTNDDRIGLELGGAVKNIIAIAAGIVDGLGLGLNTRAALITRGLAEVRRMGIHLGAQSDTFAGLAGVGDLILTCTGTLSRNHTVGKKIGQGMTLTAILADMRMVAEGVKTARSVYNLSRKLDVEMPICHEVYHVLHEDADPRQALHRLMGRQLKHETEDLPC